MANIIQDVRTAAWQGECERLYLDGQAREDEAQATLPDRVEALQAQVDQEQARIGVR